MDIKKIIKKIDRNFFSNRLFNFYNKKIRINKLDGISLDISGGCNLKCGTCCFQEKYINKGVMKLETFSKLTGEFSKLFRVELQCNAEPLLNPYIDKIIKKIKEENENIFLSMVTNGTLLNRKIASSLLKEGMNKISISVDAAEKELFEDIRKGANYETVINNIKNLIELREDINKNCEIEIVTVSSRRNLFKLHGILDLIKELKIDSWIIHGLEVYNEKMEQSVLYGNKIDPVVEKVFNELRERAVGYGIKIFLPSLKIIPNNNCFLNHCIIHWNGDVSPCYSLSYEREFYFLGRQLIHPKIIFGNINKENLFKIWNKKNYKEFRINLVRGIFPSFCKDCLLRKKIISPIN